MLCAPRGLPVATLKKHIDGHILDLKQMAHQWEKDGTKATGECLLGHVAKDDHGLLHYVQQDSCLVPFPGTI